MASFIYLPNSGSAQNDSESLPKSDTVMDEAVKLIPSLASLWKDETRRRIEDGLPSTPPIPGPVQGRIHVPLSKEDIERRIMLEKKIARLKSTLSGGDLAKDSCFTDNFIPTIFQAISALYSRTESRCVAEETDDDTISNSAQSNDKVWTDSLIPDHDHILDPVMIDVEAARVIIYFCVV